MDNAANERTDGTADEWTTVTGETDTRITAEDDLDAIVVRYRSGRDRCTLVPRNRTAEETLTAWLTADLETVVDLDDAR